MANPQMETPIVAPARARLSWQEICARYPDEWVTIVAIEWENGDEDDGEVASAVVLAHSKIRNEGLRETRALRDREKIMECAHWFTGQLIRTTLTRA